MIHPAAIYGCKLPLLPPPVGRVPSVSILARFDPEPPPTLIVPYPEACNHGAAVKLWLCDCISFEPPLLPRSTVGKSGGQKTVQQHDHLVRTGAGSAGVIEWSRPSGATGRAYPMPSGASVNTSAGFTDTTGAGINNMNPYRAVSMIIKL